ncbi:hypothetical protein IDM40_15080 [Nocardiopsis sp. HNM0947]|uniref:Lipoprotein n=1 Tax=Nocardiopsis coralli TaxID=2772213 RepID=A0ABR9P853_9ACTN|nr:hypothetical protein [Nocardiopsis coralli]MBE3000022.1 hypothetical protein [Nocardiopsis coralli]
MKHVAILPVCILSTALLLNGCSYVTPTITEDEATEKIQEHARNTLAALPEKAEIEERDGPNTSPCGNPSMLSDEDRVTVSEHFWVRGIPEEDNDTALELMHDHWETNGYQILNDSRPDDTFINAEHEENDFQVATQYNKNGTLSLVVRSPCLWPDGSPELF